MKQTQLSLPILVGTHRKDNISSQVGRYLYEKIQKRTNITPDLFLASDIVLPQDDYGQALNNTVPSYAHAIQNSDGIIIVTPEYNHGYPGTLKSILDLFLDEYMHKVAGIVGVSSGRFGGVRVVEQLLPVLRELGLVTIHTDVYVSEAQTYVGEKATKDTTVLDESIEKFLDELSWMGSVLQQGREQT